MRLHRLHFMASTEFWWELFLLPENCKTNFSNALCEDLGSSRQRTFIEIAHIVYAMLLSAHFSTYYCLLFCDIKQLLWLGLELKVTFDILKTAALLYLLLLLFSSLLGTIWSFSWKAISRTHAHFLRSVICSNANQPILHLSWRVQQICHCYWLLICIMSLLKLSNPYT